MQQLKVSVIIPCYNCADFIGETLRSLKNQSRLPDEVVCVNDGSTDGTAAAITEVALAGGLKVRLLTQSNAGVSFARNTGLDACCGDIVLFLDADDKYADNFIEQVVKGISEGYDTVYGYFTHDEGALCTVDDTVKTVVLDKKQLMADYMYNKNRCHTAAVAYKRNLLTENGIRFTVGARYGEDWEFTTKYIDTCKNALCLQMNTMLYRLSDGSAMKRVTYDHADAIKAAERAERFLADRNSDCYDMFCGYMKHRAVFSVAHTFAKHRQRDMLAALRKEYDVKASMRVISACRQAGKRARMAAWAFRISPWLFYSIIGRL